MYWKTEYLEHFEEWFFNLSDDKRESIAALIHLLEEFGPNLGRPYSDTLKGSKFKNMKELRRQHKGDPYRIIYCFDPKRRAVLILGGNKKGNNRWYKKHIPIADKLYEEYLKKEK